MSALLSLNNVSVALRGGPVVSSVTLRIESGEVIALLGPNGAGKTTLLRAALGLIAVSAGTAQLGDDNPHTLSARDRALRVAYLPQRPQSVWPISVESLVALGRFAYGAAPDRLAPVDKSAVDEAISACNLLSLRLRRMDEISGGEKARAHLARALAQNAPLLALDEPTAGLDPAQALAVGEIMRSRANKGAVIFSTHDVSLAAQVASRIVLMREGQVIVEGAPKAVLTEDNLERAYGRKAKVVEIDGKLVTAF